MTTASASDSSTPSTAYYPPGSRDCDPGLLDELACEAKGVEATAAYNAAHMEALTKARARYDGARSAYSAASDAASPLLVEGRKQVHKLVEQLECLINDEDTIARLNTSFDRVERRLHACGEQEGCYFRGDCDFDDEVRNCSHHEVPSRAAAIQRRVTEAEDCFTDLIDEPTKLAARVKKIQDEIADITKITGAPGESPDYRRLYAATLVTRQHLDSVWRGFRDVNAYIDCLCRALTCMLKGHAAIAQLKGRDAVHQCHHDLREKACAHLRDHTVDEVMAEYIRRTTQFDDEQGGDGGPGAEGGRSRESGTGVDRGGDRERRGAPDDQDRGGDGGRGRQGERERYENRERY